jgi:hypothetical protein
MLKYGYVVFVCLFVGFEIYSSLNYLGYLGLLNKDVVATNSPSMDITVVSNHHPLNLIDR